jgi:hypothetical protein
MLSTSNTILDIQTHPEMHGKIARIFPDANNSTYVGKYSTKEIEEMKGRGHDEQDGLLIIESIVD